MYYTCDITNERELFLFLTIITENILNPPLIFLRELFCQMPPYLQKGKRRVQFVNDKCIHHKIEK